MRELKFRAWDDETKTMVGFHLEDAQTNLFSFRELAFRRNAQGIPVNPIMQYIGLKDCNGVEIYEGDIVYIKNHNDWKEVWSVEYDNTAAAFVVYNQLNSFRNLEQDICYHDFAASVDVCDGYHFICEVTCNIYESPELLEDK